jgi:transposase-like protein
MLSEDFKSISELKEAFPDEQSCIEHLERLRWNGLIVSPFDPNSKVYHCKQNRYRCRNSRKYFNVKTNTLFYNSKIELQKWFVAIWLITHENRTISSIELSETLEITQKSAWFMIKHIRHYFEFEKKSGEKKKLKEKKKKIDEIEVVIEKDRLQLVEWLKQLKK